MLKDVREMAASGNLLAASHQLEALLEEQPHFFQGWSELGKLYRRMGSHTQALAIFQKAKALNPTNTTVATDIAIELRELGQYGKSAQQLNKVLSAHPNNLPALYNLGLVYKKQQKKEAAIEAFQHALETNPKHTSSSLQLADIYKGLSKIAQAQQQLETALIHRPKHLKLLLELASIAQKQQMAQQAIRYLEQACRAHPNRLEPSLRLAEAFRIFNQLDKAQTLIETLQNQHPQNLEVTLQLAHLQRQKGQRQQALATFQRAQQQANRPAQALNAQLFAAEELRELNRLDEALVLSKSATEQFPNNMRAKLITASILQRQLDLDAAEALYKSIIKTAPGSLPAHLNLAAVLRDTYRLPEAIALLTAFYNSGHRELPLLMTLGQLAKSEDDFESARHWFQQARQHHPQASQAYGALADILYNTGDISAAMALLQEGCDRLPNKPDLPLRLANLHLRFGYPDRSLNTLKTARERFPTHIPTALQLARLHFQQGNFAQASTILASLHTDQGSWIKQIERLKGDMALWQFQLDHAADHFQNVVDIPPVSAQEQHRLALVCMLTGKIEQAYAQLKSTAEELQAKQISGKGGSPISGHIAYMINQMRNNPSLCAEVERSQTEPGPQRLLTLAATIAQEPAYLGASTFLAKELRQQGIFAAVRAHLQSAPAPPTPIPKRIVQYWDAPSPPPEILDVGSSWRSHNPDYTYSRFSSHTAKRFIQRHYDSNVLQAFNYCEHPATESDLFRLAYLNIMGGFYADADDRCRKSLDPLASSNAELIVYQEENACIGNNFLACVPGQPTIRAALHQAIANLLCYNNEGPWLKTGPGLLTTALCSNLLPHIAQTDYRTWPKLCVLNQEELRTYVWWPLALPYKHTFQSWQKATYAKQS